VVGRCFAGHDRHAVLVRTAYRCRAYPDQAQQALLNRTFGCVRVVWSRTLAARQERYAVGRPATSYAQTDRALTASQDGRSCKFGARLSCTRPNCPVRSRPERKE